MRLRRRRSRVLVVYKNGYEIVLRCDRFAIERNLLGAVTKVEWTDARPDPLLLNLDEIMAVYEL